LAELPSARARNQQRHEAVVHAKKTKGVPDAQYERERREAKRRGREAERERKLHRDAAATITWLSVPVPVSPGSRTFVHGVASDASEATKAMYL